MSHMLIQFLIYLLAIYGGLTLILSILETIKGRAAADRSRVKVILAVKDVEENIEYIVKSAIKKDFTSKVMSGCSLAVVDLNSSDGTRRILEELRKDYGCLEVFSQQDRDRVFADIVSASKN